MKTACYIDGFNLYHAIDLLDNNKLKWLDLNALAKTMLKDDDELMSVMYFTSLMVWDASKLKRHKEYIKALETVGVQTVISKFQPTNKYCSKNARYCDFKEEKQTDVALATRIICDCMTNSIDKVILITADSDQVPTIAAIKAMKPAIEIVVFCPPGRASIARELNGLAHSHGEISAGRLENCLFPRNVRDHRNVVIARSPAKYQ